MKTTIAVLVAVVAAGCCCPQKSKKQIEKERAEAAEEKAEKAAAKAELAEVKRRCGDRFGSTGWEDACRELVKKRLFQPSSADFSYLMSVARENDKKRCRQIYTSTVESKNAFGTVLEHRFQCTYNPKTDRVTLDFLVMN